MDSDIDHIIKSTQGAYVVVTPDYKIAAVTDDYLKATGTKRKDLVGRSIFDALPNGRSSNGKSESLEELRAKTEQLQKEIMQRVEELEEANEDIEQKNLQLDRSNSELEAFTYSVSHDLRAPLRIIEGFADILVKDPENKLSAEGQHNLDVIVANVKQMGTLIDHLLNLSRIGRVSMSKSDLDMNEMVRNVVDYLKYLHPDFKGEIKIYHLNPGHGDAQLVKQIWSNLVANAIKFSRPKENPRVEVGSMHTNGDTVYYVKDNGVGFDMKYVTKLFGVFQKLHRAADFEGNGVGLAIVQRIVNRHGGKIWAESSEGQGTTFYFTLPH